MKKQVTILLTTTLLLFALCGTSFAQKSSTEVKKAKEQEELLKKAEIEKAKAEDLYRSRLIDASTRREEREAMNEAWAYEYQDLANKNSGFTIAYPEGYVGYMSSSQNSETLEFRKSVKESSFTKEVPFEVEEGSHKASISVSGSCKEGEIRIKILMPGGKTYTEVLLDEYGSVNWKKSFSIDEESNGKTGEWKFVIVAREATGNFSISIRSY